ncbi:hypothetical protein HK099_000292 [Clydaea vesicula]|uniref:DNA-directed RNA polymerase n=1 Tax=Clydaea vesicula TaxID=447962 RepID=A0AAD5U4D5_9FUNG|nr:hypothetical protein HK099_000292 [Clydaea vesicula]
MYAQSVSWSKIPPENHRKIILDKDPILIKHKLFKKHEKMSIEEFDTLGLDKSKLPKIYTNDLAARYCYAGVGDVVKIYRSDNKNDNRSYMSHIYILNYFTTPQVLHIITVVSPSSVDRSWTLTINALLLLHFIHISLLSIDLVNISSLRRLGCINFSLASGKCCNIFSMIDEFLLQFFHEYDVLGNIDKVYDNVPGMTSQCTFIQDDLEKNIFLVEVRLRSMHYKKDNRCSITFPKARYPLIVELSDNTFHVVTSPYKKSIPREQKTVRLSTLHADFLKIKEYIISAKYATIQEFETIETLLVSDLVGTGESIVDVHAIISKHVFGDKITKRVYIISLFVLCHQIYFRQNTDRDSYEYVEWMTPGKFALDYDERTFEILLKTGKITINNSVCEGISSVLSKRNGIDRLSSIRKIVIPIDENTDNLAIRSIHTSQKGYVCFSEISEGKTAGLSKHMAITCLVSPVFDSSELKYYLPLSSEPTSLIFIDGMCSTQFRSICRSQLKKIWKFIGVYYKDNSWYIRTTEGRPVRPMLHIETNEVHLVDPGEYIYHRHEYREINDQYIFGISSGLLPYVNHNQSARVVFASGMQKHMLPSISPKGYFNDYQQSLQTDIPIVTTQVHRTLMEYFGNNFGCYGRNCIVALTTFEGYNQEDAVVVNKKSVENGLFASIKYKRIIRDPTSIIYYDHKITGDIEKTAEKLLKDFRKNVQLIYHEDTGMHMEYRMLQIGDKIASRHAQKSIVGAIVDEGRLPYAIINGRKVVPDILINPHAIPSRMTIGQLMESNMSTNPRDGTAFRRHEPNTNNTYEMYNGETGIKIQRKITMGYVYYGALRQQVEDKYFARSGGPINYLSRQPLSGRSIGGGLRIGEMEIDALISHKAYNILNDVIEQSDKTTVRICTDCKRIVYGKSCKKDNHSTVEETVPTSYLISEQVISCLGVGQTKIINKYMTSMNGPSEYIFEYLYSTTKNYMEVNMLIDDILRRAKGYYISCKYCKRIARYEDQTCSMHSKTYQNDNIKKCDRPTLSGRPCQRKIAVDKVSCSQHMTSQEKYNDKLPEDNVPSQRTMFMLKKLQEKIDRGRPYYDPQNEVKKEKKKVECTPMPVDVDRLKSLITAYYDKYVNV